MDEFRERLVAIMAEEWISAAVELHKHRLLRVPPEDFLEQWRQSMSTRFRPTVQNMDTRDIEMYRALSENALRAHWRGFFAAMALFSFQEESTQ